MLNKEIMIRSEFTVKRGQKGTRGSTPGDFIRDYICRNDACEPADEIVLSRMDPGDTRAEKIDCLLNQSQNAAEFDGAMKKLNGKSGFAFDATTLSMPDSELRTKAEAFQKMFDKGKTVIKTVISFSTDYLRAMKVIPKTFDSDSIASGSLALNTDQVRLRLAIQQAMKQVEAFFEKLDWAASIQTDTRHVHCHLCMIDKGKGRLMEKSGEQRGMLCQKAMSRIRLAIDSYLKYCLCFEHAPSAARYEKRLQNSCTSMVESRTMNRKDVVSRIEALLPNDRRLWKAESKNPKMEQANRLARNYVLGRLEPDGKLRAYLYHQDEVIENLPVSRLEKDRQRMMQKDLLLNACINSLYGQIKNGDIEGQDSQKTPFDSFSRHAKTVSEQYSRHLARQTEMENAIDGYLQSGGSEASRVMLEYYRTELEYEKMCVDKYVRKLFYLPKECYGRLNEIEMLKEKLTDLEISLEEAYKEKRDSNAVTELKNRLGRTKSDLEGRRKTLLKITGRFGYTLDENDQIVRCSFESLDRIRDIDNHLTGRKPESMTSESMILYQKTALRRWKAMRDAVRYLEGTGQSRFIEQLNIEEIMQMQKAAFKGVSEASQKPQPVLGRCRTEGFNKIIDKTVKDLMR